jgi:hypothetical protein
MAARVRFASSPCPSRAKPRCAASRGTPGRTTAKPGWRREAGRPGGVLGSGTTWAAMGRGLPHTRGREAVPRRVRVELLEAYW